MAVNNNTNEIVLGLKHGHSLLSENDIGSVIRNSFSGCFQGTDTPFVTFSSYILSPINKSSHNCGNYADGTEGLQKVTSIKWSLPNSEENGHQYIATSLTDSKSGLLVSLNTLDNRVAFRPTVCLI